MSIARYAIFSLLDSTAKSAVVASPLESMPTAEAIAYHAALTRLEDLVSARKKALSEVLADAAKAEGTETDKGHMILETGTGDAIREKRTATKPDFDGLKNLVLEHDIPVSEVFDEIKILEVNPSKLQHAIDTGKLPKEEVESLHKSTFAVKVKPSAAVLEVLDSATQGIAEKPAGKGSAASESPKKAQKK